MKSGKSGDPNNGAKNKRVCTLSNKSQITKLKELSQVLENDCLDVHNRLKI